ASFVHGERPLRLAFLDDPPRAEDRLLVPPFSRPAPRALPPGAFAARATRPFSSYPHDPPQSGNAPVLLTHIQPRNTRRRPADGGRPFWVSSGANPSSAGLATCGVGTTF